MNEREEFQRWKHQLLERIPNTDSVGRYTLELTGDEVFYIRSLIHTDYILGFNK